MKRIALISIALIFAGCSDNSPASPTPDSIDGVWRIISIQPASQPLQTAPVGAQYQIEFQDGRASVRVDCNTCTGSFTLNDGRLTVGPALACTRAACATASYESAVVSLLAGEHQASATLHNLTLTSSRGTMLLQR
ncbi:MAG TPA: META domain-containing protein [Vicinamibacterales bacterium]